MTTWITAPAGLYTRNPATGEALPILAIDTTTGRGLTPDGNTTNQIHMIGAPPNTADADTDRNRGNYMAAVRQAEQHGIPPCPHGDPRGTRYCAHCRRTPRTP